MAAVAKIAKPLKSIFPAEPLDIFGSNFVKSISCTMVFFKLNF